MAMRGKSIRLSGILSRGGMGRVARGVARFPLRLKRSCAIKTIREDIVDARHVAMFAQEAMISFEVTGHPNIVNTRSFGARPDGRLFVAQDAEGPALDQVFSELHGRMSLVQRIAVHVLRALRHLQRLGVVHCDISLGNVLLGRDGMAKLGDFGLARRVRDAGRRHGDSVTGGLAGVPAYAAPEVLEGARPTYASDLYSLGAILCELVADAPPYGSGSYTAVLSRVRERGPLPLPDESPANLAAVINGLIQKRPQDRLSIAEAYALLCRDKDYLASEAEMASIAKGWIDDQEEEDNGEAKRVETEIDLLRVAEQYLHRLNAEQRQASSGNQESSQSHRGASEPARPLRRRWLLPAALAALMALSIGIYAGLSMSNGDDRSATPTHALPDSSRHEQETPAKLDDANARSPVDSPPNRKRKQFDLLR